MTMLPGRRVPDNEWFQWQADGRIEPGDYGCQEHNGVVMWLTCLPDGHIGWLAVHQPDKAGNYHVITEHEDGTISVGGSIRSNVDSYSVFRSDQISGAGPISSQGGWHGWLERGVWKDNQADDPRGARIIEPPSRGRSPKYRER